MVCFGKGSPPWCVSVKDQDPPHYHPPGGWWCVSVKEVVMSPRTMYVVDGH